jgi:hypothetical protein
MVSLSLPFGWPSIALAFYSFLAIIWKSIKILLISKPLNKTTIWLKKVKTVLLLLKITIAPKRKHISRI